jgi:ABC-type branched-subunit amino acid transport system permease subunit
MAGHLQFLLLGLGGGAVISVLAAGLVLTYRSSGVVNFAHAALGMWIAYTYLGLRRDGTLLLPVIGLPAEVALLPDGYRFSWATALALAMLAAAAYGLVVHALVFRPLRHAPALAKVVASLGLFLYLLAIADLRVGSQGAAVASPERLLPDGVVSLLGVDIPQDRLWLTAIVVAVSASLAALYHHSRFGLATRAAAESEKGAILLGYSPDRLAAVNWMLASMLAGAAVVLVAPIAGLSPTGTSLLIVPALAAALLGRFSSFLVTTLAGLGIGMVQSELVNLDAQIGWLPDVGLAQGVPFVVILVALVWRGQTLPGRGALSEGRFPRSPHPRRVGLWAALLGGAGVAGLVTLGSEWRQGIIVTTVTALVALSIVVLTGYVGQISLMPMALAGIAAFAMIKLTVDAHLPFPLAPLLAALVAVAVGLVAGVPAVRVRGMNLAIATLAAAVAIEELVLKWGWFTGGLEGAAVPEPTLAGVDLGIAATGADFPRPAFGILCIVVLVVAAVATANLRRGPTGLQWLAVRADERAAAAAGVDVTRAKLSAFAVSSFLAGLGGTLLAYRYDRLSVSSFVVFQSLALLAVTYLGGIASITGALLAGFLAQGGVLTAATGGGTSQAQFAVQGLALIVVAIVYPDGVSGAVHALVRRRRSTRAGPTGHRPATDRVATTVADPPPVGGPGGATPGPAR